MYVFKIFTLWVRTFIDIIDTWSVGAERLSFVIAFIGV